jgi:hypothetical protein
MLSPTKLEGELEERFAMIKTNLTERLDHEPTDDEVIEMLMAAYTPEASNPRADARQQSSAMED